MKSLTSYLLGIMFISIAYGCQSSNVEFSSGTDSPDLLKIRHKGYTLWLDCERRSAVRFEYVASEDTGDLKGSNHFTLDPSVPKSCQQLATGTYKTDSGEKYDRGHLYPKNLADSDAESIKQSNYMTNVLPQSAAMNRGSWFRTEQIAECYREKEPLRVFGGALWDSPMTDSFSESHGISEIPSHFWKVIVSNESALAWVIPNSSDATYKALDDYLVSVDDIEERTGVMIDIPSNLKLKAEPKSWTIEKGCDRK